MIESRISLSYTLLPYLISLLNDNKITPKDAISLNYLADPIELYHAGTNEFAQAICKKSNVDQEIVHQLVIQFKKNNPGLIRGSSIKTLTNIANNLFGENAKITKSLKIAGKHYDKVINTLNNQENHSLVDKKSQKQRAIDEMKSLKRLAKVISETDGTNFESLTKAIGVLTAET